MTSDFGRGCGYCGRPILSTDKRAKFCSRSCAAKANKNRLGTGGG